MEARDLWPESARVLDALQPAEREALFQAAWSPYASVSCAMLVLLLRLLIAVLPSLWLRRALSWRFQARTIDHAGSPYLTRWTILDYRDGGHLYLHFFHRGDADRELHNHPWFAHGQIIAYGYREERLSPRGVEIYEYRAGSPTVLFPGTFHRVDLLYQAKGCWTTLSVGGRQQSWGFWDRDTGVFTPWREFVARKL